MRVKQKSMKKRISFLKIEPFDWGRERRKSALKWTKSYIGKVYNAARL